MMPKAYSIAVPHLDEVDGYIANCGDASRGSKQGLQAVIR